jgi:hypothetical protein
MRTQLPRNAHFRTEELMLEFIQRGGGPKTLEDKNILVMQLQRKSGEIMLELTAEQYDKLGFMTKCLLVPCLLPR